MQFLLTIATTSRIATKIPRKTAAMCILIIVKRSRHDFCCRTGVDRMTFEPRTVVEPGLSCITMTLSAIADTLDGSVYPYGICSADCKPGSIGLAGNLVAQSRSWRIAL